MRTTKKWLRALCATLILLTTGVSRSNTPTDNTGGMLKSIIYDFDGLTTGSDNLPDGDYANHDMSYEVAPNPEGYNDMLGDRVLKLILNWNSGYGEFGKATSRFVELNTATDYLNVYFFNNSSAPADVKITFTEDDDNNNYFDIHNDDKWVSLQQVQATGAWQLISVPLSGFVDDNTGGNGTLDCGYTGQGGMLFQVSVRVTKTQNVASESHYIDMISFTEGPLPRGSSIFELPARNSNDHCMLGALGNGSPDDVPEQIEPLFSNGKKLTFVNWFLYYSYNGTTANCLPGPEVENLIQNGYTPIITWESMYAGYQRLDPVQPRLNNILDGAFDSYIDAFADKIKTYSSEVILRIFHEFEGDWYPWSLTHNGKDPATYVAAFRYVVDRFRARGATNAKWMWCLNADTKPWLRYNWIVPCYPGDNYVDYVATDIYNHPNLGSPDWKSFRFTAAESYFYLRKYFKHKPLYICEVGCRERYEHESADSQTKAEWLCQMDKDLQAFFGKTQALIFFSIVKEHDWRVNSSAATQSAIDGCIWQDQFYTGQVEVSLPENKPDEAVRIYPNPSGSSFFIQCNESAAELTLVLYDAAGKCVLRENINGAEESKNFGEELSPGIYIAEIEMNGIVSRTQLIKTEK